MTANVLPQQVELFERAGMNDHVGKPFKRDQLLNAIAGCLGDPRTHEAADQPDCGKSFDRNTFTGLVDMMGHPAIERLLDRLIEQLDACPDPQGPAAPDREQLSKTVHALVSAAGMLGFTGLSETCRQLEQACRGDEDLAPALARFTEARARAFDQIATLRQAA
jgi:HPt (histidine-containing phosphotransfer) domain-containing protein